MNPDINNPANTKKNAVHGWRLATLAILALAGLLFARLDASAQTTNAYDTASDPAYSGDGPGNGLGNAGNPNGGFGFGPWTFTVLNNGGAFINGSGPSGDSFDLWNTSGSSSTVAVRPFSSPLAPGQSFSVQLQLNSLDNSGTTNAMILQDASGNTLFSYWHVGNEANANNGKYSDLTTSGGAAINFQYAYQHFESFTFTLNSPTTYTFTDNSTGATFTGTISNSQIAQVAFFRGNSSSGTSGGGDDFQFDVLRIVSSAPATFAAQTPAPGAYSVPTTNAISAVIIPGAASLNSSSVVLQVDGGSVTPTVTPGTGGALDVSYHPAPLSAGTAHTVLLSVTDGNHNTYTNTWSFTTGFASLPAVLAGPIVCANLADIFVFTAAGDAWLGTNYGPGATKTLYATFSMNFNNLNGETGNGGGFGGLQMSDGATPYLIVGNNWPSLNWSFDTQINNEADLNPVIPIVFNTWHTLVERINYVAGQDATVYIWLDPNFALTEEDQTNAPVTILTEDNFDSIQLRVGNGTTSATFSNIVISATSAGAGFAAPSAPQFETQVPAPASFSFPVAGAISVQVVPGGAPVSAISFSINGNIVTPSLTTNQGIITVSYVPTAALSPGAVQTAQVVVEDGNNSFFTNAWSFTTGFTSLPAVLPGPIVCSNLGDIYVFTAAGDAWLGTNYGTGSSETLYATFSMNFNNLNNESGNGGGFGGLQMSDGATPYLIVGNNWPSLNWSFDTQINYEADLNPVTPVVFDTWHTVVERIDYAAGQQATVNMWLDPDFTQTEANQPNAPVTISTMDNFDSIQLRVGNGSASATFSNIVISATSAGAGFAAPAAPQFQSYVPAVNAISAAATTPISVLVVFGSYTISTNDVTMQLDGNNVTPTFGAATNSLTIMYQPPTAFAGGSAHTATVTLTDANGDSYSTSWSFTVDQYPSLPVVAAGPYLAVTGQDVILWSTQNEWIGANYGPNSSNTLYGVFSMEFLNSFNGKTNNDGGGAFGGLEFFLGNNEVFLIGDNWLSDNWSVSVDTASTADVPPVTQVSLNTWVTFALKCQYNSGADATVEVWLNPNFTNTITDQPNPPLTLSMNNIFDSIHLRAGNGGVEAEFTNIVFAATAQGIGFPPMSAPATLSIQNVSGSIQLSWSSVGTLQAAPLLTGPWADFTNQSNPQVLSITNAAQFFRLQQ